MGFKNSRYALIYTPKGSRDRLARATRAKPYGVRQQPKFPNFLENTIRTPKNLAHDRGPQATWRAIKASQILKTGPPERSLVAILLGS